MTVPLRSRLGGFTLVEVLVAFTLLGVAFALVAGTLGFTRQAWNRSEAAATRSADLRLTHRMLERTLSRAVALPLTRAGENPVRFLGDAHGFRFLALMPPYPAQGGLHRIEFRIEVGDDGLRLWLTQAPLTGGIEQASGAERHLLLQSDRALAFDYLTDRGDWQPRWETQAMLPRLVRLTLDATDGGRLALTTTPGVDTAADCLRRGETPDCGERP